MFVPLLVSALALVPYWRDPRIHNMGNVGLGGGLHAAIKRTPPPSFLFLSSFFESPLLYPSLSVSNAAVIGRLGALCILGFP